MDGSSHATYPIAMEIPVYVGMPVLTCANGAEHHNGEYGTIIRVNKKSVRVRREDGTEFRVSSKKIYAETGNGEVYQLPIMPAYAMTFHRVQGVTLTQAIIHPECWAPGQLYVGLSRVKTKAGLILASKISPRSIVCDPIALQALDYVQNHAA